VTKFNTLLRVVYTLGAYLILSQAAYAQTVLNFAKATAGERFSPGFVVINPTTNYADVQFTYYGLDGSPVTAGLVNPVRYRVAPKGQLAMRASEVFAGARGDGWVQVSSPTAGLTGLYFAGDFTNSLEGAETSQAFSTQVVPVIRDDQVSKTELLILNPGTSASTVSVTLYAADGREAGIVAAQVIPGHGMLRLGSGALNISGTVSARISASAPVAATAIVDRGDAMFFVQGQAVDQPSPLRVMPHFLTSSGFNPTVILTNPTASTVSARVSVLTENGSPVVPENPFHTFNIPANGSITADIRFITGQPIAPTVNGWLRVDSANVPLAGVVILDQPRETTAVALQSGLLSRFSISQVTETERLFTGFSLVNPSGSDASVDLSIVRPDGTTVAQDTINVSAGSKFQRLLRDVLPNAAGQPGGYLVVRSSTPLFGIGMLGASDNRFLAAMPPNRVPDTFAPGRVVLQPSIAAVYPGPDVQSGMTIRVSLSNAPTDPAFVVAGQSVAAKQVGPFSGLYELTLPPLETGSVSLLVRNGRIESAPVMLRVLPNDSIPTQTVSGAAFYQKFDVTDAGLDLGRPVMLPVRNARVEVFSRTSQSVVAVSETDARGRFSVPVPFDPDLSVRVLSRMRGYDLRVSDNTNQNQLYTIAADVDGRSARSDVLLLDNTRMSGAFNILEMIERGNDMIRAADPNIVPPPVTIFWSTRNWRGNGLINIGQGMVGTTYFNVANNTAYVLGDRNDHGTDSDSDEFDDAVIAHEYAHLLASKFSRDDSPGGRHGSGDILDPRVAWSEGWANFFSSAVRNDAIWRDSRGFNGAGILRYDLEDNVPAGDQPGYWSEASVDTILWDMFDDHADSADDTQYSFDQIWAGFTDLRDDRFVYLPYFLEHFLSRNPGAADAVRSMVQSRSIAFQPNVRPSVEYPFPTPINVGAVVPGTVDSFSTRRTNLANSAHFYSFTTTAGAASIRLDIAGVGPGDNPNANDLDLFLMDTNGRIIGRSDRGLNGQSELIAQRLGAGTYIVEVRSFYTRAETGGYIFNSGQYKLSVSVQ